VRRQVPADPAYTRPGADYVPRESGQEPGPKPAEPRLLRCGDLVLDEARWTVYRAGTPLQLSPTEFRLLACLMRHQGSVLTKSQLLQYVWGFGYTGHAQVVETYVSYLRRKLDRFGPPLIYTRRGVGYTLRSPEIGTAPDAEVVRPAQ
jgi:two-component system OmpR family response regulator